MDNNKNDKGSSKSLFLIIAVTVILLVCLIWFQGKRNQDINSGNASLQVVSGVGQGFKGDITATVSYENGKIIDLSLVGPDETPDIGGTALDTLEKQILQNGTTNGVDVVTGATYSSKGAFNAIDDAMKKLTLRN